MKRVRVGDRFLNLINGEKRVLKDIKKDGSFVFDDGSKANSLDVYEYRGSDEPIEVFDKKDVKLVKGKLFIKDEEIESGSLNIVEVLSLVKPGSVLLKALSDNKENAFTIIEYNYYDDSFNTIIDNYTSDLKLVGSDLGEIFLINHEVSEVITVEEPGEETSVLKDKEIQTRYTSLFVYNHSGGKDFIDLEDPVDKLFVKKETDSHIVLIFKTSDCFISVEDYDGECYDVVESLDKGDETILEYIFMKVDSDEEFLVYESNYTHHVSGLKDLRVTYKDDFSLILVFEDKFIYTNNGYHHRIASGKEALDLINKYPHFIKIEPGITENTFILANDAGDIAKLKVIKTNDRGFVTSIE